MSNTLNTHDEVINKIIAEIKSKLPKEQLGPIEDFVRQYFAFVSEDDLREHSIADLYGAVLSHWNFLGMRKNNETKIQIFNPSFKQNGWQSKNTIIEIVADDVPFVVDSIRIALLRKGFAPQFFINPPMMYIERDATGKLLKVSTDAQNKNNVQREAIIHVEIEQQNDSHVLHELEKELKHVLSDVNQVVEDWQKMRQQIQDTVTHLEKAKTIANVTGEDRQEIADFLKWLADDNFTILATCEYKLQPENGSKALKPETNSGLGLLRDGGKLSNPSWLKEIPIETEEEFLQDDLLIIRQLIEPSNVHRPTSPYCVGVKCVDSAGNVTSKLRIIGLFTSAAYNGEVQSIPILRRKVKSILERSELNMQEHAGKELLNILATYPRDEMFQAKEDELYANAVGIMHLQERPKIRLFLRQDNANRFYSCLVYVPREIFTSELRYRMGEILCDALHGRDISFQTKVSESTLARIHFIILTKPNGNQHKYDKKDLENKLIEAGRTWEDDLHQALLGSLGETKGNASFLKYRSAFPAGYRETFKARTAVFDIEHIEKLSEENKLGMSFYRPLEQQSDILNFRLYHLGSALPLSDILPMLENMGLRILTETSYHIHLPHGKLVWVSDFAMQHQNGRSIDVEQVRDMFQDAFAHVWIGDVENDGFNKLVLSARLSWRATNILRAYAKYFRQTGVAFSQSYIEQALANHPNIAGQLVNLFEIYFNPKTTGDRETLAATQITQIIDALNEVSSLDEDRILRRYLDVFNATLRTNFYQTDENGENKSYISFKFKSNQIPELPLPHPLFEIFVYSPRVEGIHLRSAKVARGGLRWSDRLEDFRTEVLGLMKAQQVKNSIIVPAGAKGGFVCKQLPTDGNRDTLMQEVVRCYSIFICGLLDITDNLHGTEVVPPVDVVRRDSDDPYLVVAADKGTATFSDLANSIAQKYDFWLGDAFASGGSAGYDHKKMGITARGAWVSVSRHFRELGIDIQKQDFTVIGIGDMSGDVFGNGMLLSRHIKLVAAFNHQHIFLDPNPNPEVSFMERDRLFKLPRSTWEDYDAKTISAGGGVFSRAVKSIKLSKEVRELLHTDKEEMMPNELVKTLLTTKVDLLWNGGIGTYAKSSSERNADVGDRSNDAVRVNGKELKCRVIGEGGNLGFTQLSRVEYSLNGGICYTDFVDNSGGVDCSDHEVNLKILLNSIVTAGDLTHKQRNKLLEEMTDPVAIQVLNDNYQQTQAISLAESRTKRTLDENVRFITTMERLGKLDRQLEFLPNDDELARRKTNGLGLTRPELSILVAYSKMYLKEQLLNSDVPEDEYLLQNLRETFLGNIGVKYAEYLDKHKLRRELIATQWSNAICNEMGPTFVTRLNDETGASAPEIARSFIVARQIFSLRTIFDDIAQLDNIVDSSVQKQMMTDMIRLVRRATRWFLRNRRLDLDIANTVAHFGPQLQTLQQAIPQVVVGIDKDQLQANQQKYAQAGVPDDLALTIASAGPMISALDIVEAADLGKLPVLQVSETYFAIGLRLKLDWFREELDKHMVANTWDALARAACKDDLDRQQRTITMAILRYPVAAETIQARIDAWIDAHKILIDRWLMMVADLRATKSKEFTMFTVALRELLDLAQAAIKKVK